MTNQASLQVVEELAKEMEMDELLDHYGKTKDPSVRDRVKEVVVERRSCPNCGNDMMMDEDNDILYCPLGHFDNEM